ncbi:MAG: VTT domain-containing protein [Anaerovorax sp.]
MVKEINIKKKKTIQMVLMILKFGLLLFILVGIPLYFYFFQGDLLNNFRSLDALNVFLEQHKTSSIFVYIGLQVLQIVICIIPGQALQFAAGYAYAFWFGYLFSIIGAAVGTVVTFYLARLLGRDALHMLFGEEKFGKFLAKLNTKRAVVLVFILFLIPGIPKDLLNYAAGVSNMNLKPFLIISLVARTPAMMCSVMIGSMFNKGSYFGIGVLTVLAIVLCILGMKYHETLAKRVDGWYVKLMKM